ncbi:MAG: DUF1772 domain-containing protein [Acidobacteriota bacterium]
MIRKIVHFLAVCSAGIITGGQYVVSFDYGTTGMSASFYTEKMQYAIHHIGTPLFGMLIAATLLHIIAAVMYFKADRRTCYLLAGAGACFLVGGLITKFGNIPLLDMIDTWNVSSPPANWLEIAEQWYRFHTVRIAVDLAGLVLAVFSAFTRRD